jgi:hypothetical protein
VGTVGLFNWADLTTSDREAAVAFYTGLFDWESDDQPSGESQIYTIFKNGGKQVAGGGEYPPDMEGMPPRWTPYVTVTDADATAAKVVEAGGSTMMGPLDVMDAGRMAIFIDPTGVPFAVWQDGNHTGAELKGEPGSLTWVELASGDIAAATKFYGEVFGWGAETAPMGESGEYTLFRLGEENAAGGYDKAGVLPDEVPAHWLAYFAVDDIDATVEKAKALGGTATDVMEVEMAGRFSVITDPQGAVFGAIQSPG